MAEPINSITKLSFILGVPKTALEKVAREKSKHYRPYVKSYVKSSGETKQRRIDNPDKAIRSIQRLILKHILHESLINLPDYITGSIPGRSIKSNANPHVRAEAILCLDIKDCFPSITSQDVYLVFRDTLFCVPPVAKILTKLTTYGNRLPQGPPTSPALSNLVLYPMLKDLKDLSNLRGIHFTNYVDDLTFSGTYDSLKQTYPLIRSVVKGYGFKLNTDKTIYELQSSSQRVTGLIVNQHVSVGRKYLRKIERNIMNLRATDSIWGQISFVQSVSKHKALKLRTKLLAKRTKRSDPT